MWGIRNDRHARSVFLLGPCGPVRRFASRASAREVPRMGGQRRASMNVQGAGRAPCDGEAMMCCRAAAYAQVGMGCTSRTGIWSVAKSSSADLIRIENTDAEVTVGCG